MCLRDWGCVSDLFHETCILIYIALMQASLLSRVTTVLPFVPFSRDEKMAITAEALYSLGGDQVETMSPQDIESLISRALRSYLAVEGARSLYRAVSNQLIEFP